MNMYKEIEIYFSRQDFEDYRKWIDLNISAVTWQGKYRQEFKEFWEAFLLEGQSLRQISERFSLAILRSKVGPLVSWFTWLRDRLIAFTFCHKDISIISLGHQFQLSLADTSTILRNFFLSANPHLDEELSDIFQITHISDGYIHLNFKKLQELFPEKLKVNRDSSSDVMTSMEVTLYPEWRDLADRINRDLYHQQFNFRKIKSRISFRDQLKILRELAVMGIAVATLIFSIKKVNEIWNQNLTDKISIYGPQLKWLDKTLSFKDENSASSKPLLLPPQELESVEISGVEEETFNEDARYEVESEAVMTLWDDLPKDFDFAELEKSDYEEGQTSSYRDSRYGNTKVYRVMMKSVDTLSTRTSLDRLIRKYQVTRVGDVEPGKDVPGGIYYNIFVPRHYLKEFMAQVMEMDDAVLYESRTRTRHGPPGKNKVFIWVKAI